MLKTIILSAVLATLTGCASYELEGGGSVQFTFIPDKIKVAAQPTKNDNFDEITASAYAPSQ